MSKQNITSMWEEWLSGVEDPDNQEVLAGFRDWMRRDAVDREHYTEAVMKGWLVGGGCRTDTIH